MTRPHTPAQTKAKPRIKSEWDMRFTLIGGGVGMLAGFIVEVAGHGDKILMTIGAMIGGTLGALGDFFLTRYKHWQSNRPARRPEKND